MTSDGRAHARQAEWSIDQRVVNSFWSTRCILEAAPHYLHGTVVVRLRHLVTNVLDVLNPSRPADYDYCTLQEAPLLDQDAVGLTEFLAAVSGQRGMMSLLRATPACLGKGEVHADRVENDGFRQFASNTVPTTSLHLAYRSVQ